MFACAQLNDTRNPWPHISWLILKTKCTYSCLTLYRIPSIQASGYIERFRPVTGFILLTESYSAYWTSGYTKRVSRAPMGLVQRETTVCTYMCTYIQVYFAWTNPSGVQITFVMAWGCSSAGSPDRTQRYICSTKRARCSRACYSKVPLYLSSIKWMPKQHIGCVKRKSHCVPNLNSATKTGSLTVFVTCFIMKINNSRVDLTDMPAETKSLLRSGTARRPARTRKWSGCWPFSCGWACSCSWRRSCARWWEHFKCFVASSQCGGYYQLWGVITRRWIILVIHWRVGRKVANIFRKWDRNSARALALDTGRQSACHWDEHCSYKKHEQYSIHWIKVSQKHSV